MNSIAAIEYLDDTYFLYMPESPEAEIKKTVEHVSQNSDTSIPCMKD